MPGAVSGKSAATFASRLRSLRQPARIHPVGALHRRVHRVERRVGLADGIHQRAGAGLREMQVGSQGACTVPKLIAWPVTCGFADRSGGSWYSLITPPRTRRRRTGASIATTTAGSWLGGCWSRLWCGRCSLKWRSYSREHGAGVALVVDQHPVGALGPDAADEPFGVAVRPGRPRWGLDDLDAFGGEHGVEGAGELRVSVADQEPERGRSARRDP